MMQTSKACWGYSTAALVGAVLLGGCDPCAGVVGCSSPARVSASGRIVNYPAGRAVAGVRITMAVQDQDTTVLTDADGFWTAALPATTSGAASGTGGSVVLGRVTVAAPTASQPYVVDCIPLRMTTRRGDGTDVGRWYDEPQVRFTGELRAQRGLNLVGATVRVDRVGGVEGDVNGLTSGLSEGNQFYVEAPARGVGEMKLRLRVSGPGLPRAFTLDSVRIRPRYKDGMPPLQGSYFVGNTLPYVARIERRGTRAPWAGVRVVFRRTGGIRVASPSLTMTSTPEGLVSLQLEPLEQGTLQGELEVQPPSPLPSEIFRVSLTTLDDVLRFAGAFPVGPWLPYVVRLYRRGLNSSFAGVRATFRRRSGVATAVDTLTMTSTPDGLVSLQLPPLGVGELVGDLELRPPDPLPAMVIPNIRVNAVLNDSLRLIRNIGVGPALPYALRIFRRGLDTPFAGVTAIFRRTGGVNAIVDSLVTQSTTDGLVSLQLVPVVAGTLTGDLELRLPAPLAPTFIRGITLTAQEDDSVRLAGNRGVGPQVRYAFQFYERTSFQNAPAGVEVSFQPVNGPMTQSTRESTMSGGIVGVTGPATAASDVEGDLFIRWAPPRAPEVRRIRLRAYEDDSVRFGGYFGAGPSLLYVGSVEDVATREPIRSGRAEFRRTGGIAVREALFSWDITSGGLFRIAPTPLADGDVIGDLTLRLPVPYRDTTFTGVRLSTFSTDETRPGPVFRVQR